MLRNCGLRVWGRSVGEKGKATNPYISGYVFPPSKEVICMIWELLARVFGPLIEMLMYDEAEEDRRLEEFLKRVEARLGTHEPENNGGQDELH